MIVNVMEELVDQRLDALLRNFECCKCSICREDMKCLALNSLPPKYVSTEIGALFAKVDNEMITQLALDLDVVVLRIIQYVSARVRHAPIEQE
jgi:competence protein ComFB